MGVVTQAHSIDVGVASYWNMVCVFTMCFRERDMRIHFRNSMVWN